MNQTDWTPGLIVLGIGLVAAVIFIVVGKLRAPAGPKPSTSQPRQDDLNERYRRLIEQLRELDADRSHLDDAAYAAERSRLELQAAETLRLREGAAASAAAAAPVQASAPAPAAAPQGFAARNPQLVGALWGAGIVGFFVVLGLVLSNETRERGENDNITGADPNVKAGMPPAPPLGGRNAGPGETPLDEAIAAVKADPTDLEAASFASHELLMQQRWDEARKIINGALAVDPFHVESRVHKAVLRGVEGDQRGSLEELEKLADLYPGSEEALLFGGAMAMQFQQPAVALRMFERFAVEQPPRDHPPQLTQAIGELRRELGR